MPEADRATEHAPNSAMVATEQESPEKGELSRVRQGKTLALFGRIYGDGSISRTFHAKKRSRNWAVAGVLLVVEREAMAMPTWTVEPKLVEEVCSTVQPLVAVFQ
jgi:hypothetical protein